MKSNKKVLGICVSGRENGNSSILLKELLKPSKEKGYDIEIVNLGELKILPCTSCSCCVSEQHEVHKCILPDDLELIKGKIAAADAIAISSPSYCLSAPSRLRAILERTATWAISEMAKGNKKKYGAAVSVAGGTYSLLRTPLSLFLGLYHCEIVGQFTIGTAFNKGEVLLVPSKLKKVNKLGKDLAESVEQDRCIKSTSGECEDRLVCTNCYSDTFQIRKDGKFICPVCCMELKQAEEGHHSVGVGRFTHEGARLYGIGIKSNIIRGLSAADEVRKRLRNYVKDGVLPDEDYSTDSGLTTAKGTIQWDNEALDICEALAPSDVRKFFQKVIEQQAMAKGIKYITKEVLLKC
jgi:multimeric flavodoxin WrbA